MTEPPFDPDAVLERLGAAHQRSGVALALLDEPARTVLVVAASRGIINNGGLQYFFESDWEGHPPYSMFVDAYRAIGATEAASTLERAVALFSFHAPHRHREQRWQVLESRAEEFESLGLQMIGDDSVSQALADFIRRNRVSLSAYSFPERASG